MACEPPYLHQRPPTISDSDDDDQLVMTPSQRYHKPISGNDRYLYSSPPKPKERKKENPSPNSHRKNLYSLASPSHNRVAMQALMREQMRPRPRRDGETSWVQVPRWGTNPNLAKILESQQAEQLFMKAAREKIPFSSKVSALHFPNEFRIIFHAQITQAMTSEMFRAFLI